MFSMFHKTGLTQSRAQTPFCLRQHGTSHYICGSFFPSASEKTNHKRKYSTAVNNHIWALRKPGKERPK
jgi:hypothetical protein